MRESFSPKRGIAPGQPATEADILRVRALRNQRKALDKGNSNELKKKKKRLKGHTKPKKRNK